MSIELDDIAGTIDQYRQLMQQIKDLTEAANLLKNDIIEALRGEESGTVEGKPVVKYITYSSDRFDSVGFKAAHPDIAAKFIKTSEGSRFTLVDETR